MASGTYSYLLLPTLTYSYLLLPTLTYSDLWERVVLGGIIWACAVPDDQTFSKQ